MLKTVSRHGGQETSPKAVLMAAAPKLPSLISECGPVSETRHIKSAGLADVGIFSLFFLTAMSKR